MIALPPTARRTRKVNTVLLTAAVLLNVAGVLSLRTAFLVADILPRAEAKAVPVWLRIPSIDVDAPIIGVGLRPDKSMDAPKTAHEVGWFNQGYVPGDKGNAVLAGHLDTQSGQHAVFWDLHRLEKGDVLQVQHDDGSVRLFRVRDIKTYPMDKAPMEKIFGTATGSRLNLITCKGEWQNDEVGYDERLVVYTEQVEEKIFP